MKSLIFKDIYNISHNAKAMFLMLLVFLVIFFPMYGIESYIIISGILCSMMVVTTFTFDNHSEWTKYALVMPLSRKDLVLSKFIVLFIFTTIGIVFGIIFGIIGGLVTSQMTFDIERLTTLLFIGLAGLAIAEILGSISIPLVFKYGSEKARMLLIISFSVPVAILFIGYKILLLLGISITDQFVFILICVSPIFVLIWNYIMFKISYSIFSKVEF